MMMDAVTSIHAPISVDGKTYNQSEMGVNAVVQPGDQLTWLLPAADGKVHKFTYVAVDSYVSKVKGATKKENAALQYTFNKRLNAPDKQGEQILRTYKCWQPGSDVYRLVDEWKLVSSEEIAGTVKPVGHVTHSGSNR